MNDVHSQQVEKRAFDRSAKFTIFGSWMENFTRLEKYGVEMPYALFKGIADYSMYGVLPDFSDIEDELKRDMLYQIFISIRPNIETSIAKRKGNFASMEKNERELMILNFKKDNPSASVREISDATGVSKSAVQRILEKNNVKTVSDPSVDQKEPVQKELQEDDLPF